MEQATTKPPALTRRRFLIACGGAAAVGLFALARQNRDAGAPGVSGQLKLFERSSAALGSSVSIAALHQDPAVAERALDAAFAELERIEQVMSLYRPDSQLCRLNRDGVLADPHPYLVEILTHARDAARRSDGAFDVTVQPLWNLYADAKRAGRVPTDAELATVVRNIDWRSITVSDREIRLRDRSMSITLNGIAQGFATDKAMAALKANGITHALVNAGEISTLGRKASGEMWQVGIQHPREKDAYIAVAALDGRCMSTSGDYETAFSADLSSNHIVDPSTGRSPTAFASVSVVAPTATEADALSTAIFVLGPDRGLALARATASVDVMFVLKDGQTLTTPGFPLASQKEASHVAA
jgi:thiamine biosynthesis lipoprotein